MYEDVYVYIHSFLHVLQNALIFVQHKIETRAYGWDLETMGLEKRMVHNGKL